METAKAITVTTLIDAPVEKVWRCWTEPSHITQWNNASDDWHTPRAENDLRVGGRFISRMEARDGSAGFDFEGVYEAVEPHKLISYAMSDGRTVKITFEEQNGKTTVTETFDADASHPLEMQQAGWQAILDNFKKHVEDAANIDKLHFETVIDAPVEKVYKSMLDQKLYAEWTSVFNPTSHYEGSWEKGAKILFIGCDQDGKTGGMVSRIRENIPNKFVSIEHLGLYQDGKEITSGKEIEDWAGALENYSFEEVDGKTRVAVETDTNEQFKEFFSETWPQALSKLKELCER